MHNRILTNTRSLALAGLVALSSMAVPAAADVLLIDTVQQAPANTTEGLPRPVRGMKMADVERIYGAPASKRGPVGDPPITRWEYDRYTVVFEQDSVLHSVVHRPGQP